MNGKREEDEAQSAEEVRVENAGLPPFVRSWGMFYALVIINLLVLILLFYGIQVYFA